MGLAAMYGADRDALLCDLAETYHIYDFEALPVDKLAVLSYGLRDDSRIKMHMAGLTPVPEQAMFVNIADTLQLIRYQLFAKKHDPKPILFTDRLLNTVKESNTVIFESGEAFEEARRKLIEGVNNG